MNHPFVIIGGTFKSGTSSLFTYLNQVKSIEGSSIKETGFFVPARYNLDTAPIENYYNYFQENSDTQYYLEASPGYLYGGRKIATKIKKELGEEVYYVFMLREPVSRFKSFYQMIAEGNWHGADERSEKMTLADYFDRCKEYQSGSQETDFIYSGLSDGNYVTYLKEWFDSVPASHIRIVDFESFTSDPETEVMEILDWLKINRSHATGISYRAVNQFRAHKSGALKKVASTINRRFESFWRRNEKLKIHVVKWYERLNTKKEKSQDDPVLDNSIKEYYREANGELRAFLQEKGYPIPKWL